MNGGIREDGGMKGRVGLWASVHVYVCVRLCTHSSAAYTYAKLTNLPSMENTKCDVCKQIDLELNQ